MTIHTLFKELFLLTLVYWLWAWLLRTLSLFFLLLLIMLFNFNVKVQLIFIISSYSFILVIAHNDTIIPHIEIIRIREVSLLVHQLWVMLVIPCLSPTGFALRFRLTQPLTAIYQWDYLLYISLLSSSNYSYFSEH